MVLAVIIYNSRKSKNFSLFLKFEVNFFNKPFLEQLRDLNIFQKKDFNNYFCGF